MSMERITAGTLLLAAMAFTVLMLVTLIRCILGPRFTDRVVAVNMINTMVLAIIAILCILLGEDFLVDVALVYALLSFLAVVVLSRLITARRKEHQRRERLREMEEAKDVDLL